jgi:hypothetical protein
MARIDGNTACAPIVVVVIAAAALATRAETPISWPRAGDDAGFPRVRANQVHVSSDIRRFAHDPPSWRRRVAQPFFAARLRSA